MKRLAMVLAVAFTMGLASSTVSASTKGEKKDAKQKTESCCKKDAKACCNKDKK